MINIRKLLSEAHDVQQDLKDLVAAKEAFAELKRHTVIHKGWKDPITGSDPDTGYIKNMNWFYKLERILGDKDGV